ncbi:MAG: tRNA uridine-5-carboxymethylaminomethyl(34) synthesis GTPase MnmE, partial [Pseudomonadota bacterium]|nr:tRNA uridine-5-carboxymethylaminomethyl(34) synthesis GTPase MnmE [Pseudomonadota bacterium]
MYNTINSKTIYALSSAPGKSGIAVIRVSGPEAKKIGNLFNIDLPDPKKVQIVKLVHPHNGDLIDKALITFFKSPNSFTGENMVELSIHGGKAIKDLIFSILAAEDNFSYAEPGEFTKRAFLNGKLDLVEVEGLADLINAETEFQRKQAFDQMEGKLSNLYTKWKGQLVKNLSYLEATIDFVEEGVSPEVAESQIKDIKVVLSELDAHLNDSNKGERLRDGFHIIIAGSPNTGKSSLLNHLSNRDIAIVSDEAGTTRDSLDAYLDINGFPVIITDTAGIRKAKTEVENIGIKKSQTKMNEADLVLWLMDSSINKNDGIPNDIKDKSIEVWTKSDISIHKNK